MRHRPRPLRTCALLTFLTCLPATSRGQEPGSIEPASQEPTPSSTLLSRLGARNLPLPDAQQLWQDLSDRPVEARGQALELIRRHYVTNLRDFDKSRDRSLRQTRKLVPQCQRDLLGRKGAAEVDTLRAEALAVTHRPELDKQHIHDEIDPRLQRLRDLLLPTPDQLLAFDAEHAQGMQSLRQQLDQTRGWFDLYIGGLHTLDEVPGGRRLVDRQKPPPDPPNANTLDQDLEHWCLAALPMSGRDQKALERNLALAADLPPEESHGTFLLNGIRYALGLSLVTIDEKLTLAARDHSQDMQRLGFFSHTSPVDGKHTPSDRAARAGTSGGTENIAAGQNSGRGAIEAWWYSPGHHKNMLGNHSRTGLGRAENLWTQMFGN